jgi:GTP cyclohydrolase III
LATLAKKGEFNISFYYAIDGDDIGKKLEEYALKNDISAIEHLSLNVKNTLSHILQYLCSEDAKIIFCEGDSLLAYSDKYISLPNEMLIESEISFSAGIGKTPGAALLALKKAKGLGKKRTEIFMEEPR